MRIDLPQPEGDEINLAPLIDCVFLLLIFFMVATTFDQQDVPPDPIEELLINLPTAAASIETANLSAPLVIAIDARGRYSIDGERTSVSALHEKLKSVAVTTPQRRLRIDGDKDVAYQHVAHVLDVCQFVGLENIGARMR
jgi:biopolymer transport protein ExbD